MLLLTLQHKGDQFRAAGAVHTGKEGWKRAESRVLFPALFLSLSKKTFGVSSRVWAWFYPRLFCVWVTQDHLILFVVYLFHCILARWLVRMHLHCLYANRQPL